jgi:hypothetical protein
MVTNPHLVSQLVEAHERDLMAAARQARLRRAAKTARRRTGRPFTQWLLRHSPRRPAVARARSGVHGIRLSHHQSSTQTAR